MPADPCHQAQVAVLGRATRLSSIRAWARMPGEGSQLAWLVHMPAMQALTRRREAAAWLQGSSPGVA